MRVPDLPRGPVRLDEYGSPIENVYIRKVERVNGALQNTVIETLPAVSQFWKYDPAEYLKQPLYARAIGAPALELRNLSRAFGGLKAVDGVSLTVQPGERRALIGPNGAGKTTLFNLISGEIRPTEGSIVFREPT